MRIAQVIPTLGFGGAEREVARTGVLLSRNGLTCDIVCLYEEGHLSQDVRHAGTNVIALNLKRRSSIATRFYGLARFLKRNAYDITHVHLVPWAVLAARYAGARAVFLTEHGLSLYKGKAGILFDRWISRFCNRTIVVARAIMETRRAQWKIPCHKMVFIPNSVDSARFDIPESREEIRARLEIPTGHFFNLSVGSLTPVKGQTFLVQAAAQVVSSYPNATFAIAGGGTLFRDLKEQVAAWGLGEQFRLLGYRTDIERLLKAADLFVLPSLREGTSIAILEAMSAGVPVVATAVGGNSELVIDGTTGLLVPPRNPKELANAILRLIRDESLRKRFAEAAIQRVRSEYSQDVNLEKLKGLYTDALRGTI